MRTTTVLFLVALFAATQVTAIEMKTDMETQLELRSKIESLKKSDWGEMALLMIEVQMATNGPLDELMNAFRNML